MGGALKISDRKLARRFVSSAQYDLERTDAREVCNLKCLAGLPVAEAIQVVKDAGLAYVVILHPLMGRNNADTSDPNCVWLHVEVGVVVAAER